MRIMRDALLRAANNIMRFLGRLATRALRNHSVQPRLRRFITDSSPIHQRNVFCHVKRFSTTRRVLVQVPSQSPSCSPNCDHLSNRSEDRERSGLSASIGPFTGVLRSGRNAFGFVFACKRQVVVVVAVGVTADAEGTTLQVPRAAPRRLV